MALSPGRLQRVVWGALPGALYFGIRAVQELIGGAVWNGVSFAAMAVLVGSAPLLASGGAPRGRHAVAYAALVATGIAGWVAGSTAMVRIAGFLLVVAVQVVAILLSRRLPPAEAEPARVDEPTALNLRERQAG
jgi:hypothetical protein